MAFLLFGWCIHVDVDRLGLHVFLDALRPALAANTTLLEATEWRLRGGVECRVDADGSSFDLASDSQRTSNVAGIDGCYEKCS